MSKCEIDFKAHKCEFCKDCIHGEVCMWRAYPQDPAEHCQFFKDKFLFVELPCKVGETVWCIDEFYDEGLKVVERIVMQFTVFKDTTKLMAKVPNKIGWERGYDVKQFGKTVFLTKEEAEKKLKEVQDG